MAQQNQVQAAANNADEGSVVSGVSYKERKDQSPGREEKWLEQDGIEYSTNEPLITSLFDMKQLPEVVHNAYGVNKVNRSYIYIISKKIDRRTFFKIGMSNLGNTKSKISTRLESAQTFLIPGLKNNGFKLHYVFFYRREALDSGTSYGELIERELHSYLKFKFEKAVIYMPTNHRSEWYLPDVKNYKTFINEVLMYISVQIPEPEEAYHFFISGSGRNKKLVREHKEQFMEKASNEEIIEHRHDHIAQKKTQRAETDKIKQRPLLKRGNARYFTDKLIRKSLQNNPPLGKNITVVNIYYHKQKSDILRTFGEYYVQIENTNRRQVNTPPSNIIISFTDNKTTPAKYFTHISHVLGMMKTEETLEAYGLLNNYNYYYDKPIKDAKLFLNRESNAVYKYTINKCQWLLGRVVRDKSDNLYRAVELAQSQNINYVKKVIYHQVDDKYEFINPRVVRKADPRVAITLAVDFHENRNHIGLKYNIDNANSVRGKQLPTRPAENYDLYDFVQFKPNYFKIGDQMDPEQHIGVILQKKWDYAKNHDTGESQYEYQYEILFSDGPLWNFSTDEVDNNSNPFKNKRQIKKFLDSATNKKNAIYHLYEKYGIDRPDVQLGSTTLPASSMRVANPQSRVVNRTTSATTTRKQSQSGQARRSTRKLRRSSRLKSN